MAGAGVHATRGWLAYSWRKVSTARDIGVQQEQPEDVSRLFIRFLRDNA
jgi:hypothetical protein